MKKWKRPRFSWEKTLNEIKNEVMRHFAYHNMDELCDGQKFKEACDILRKRKLPLNFYNITGVMKERFYGKENCKK